jgi:hypothetical protein
VTVLDIETENSLRLAMVTAWAPHDGGKKVPVRMLFPL